MGCNTSAAAKPEQKVVKQRRRPEFLFAILLRVIVAWAPVAKWVSDDSGFERGVLC